MSTVELQTRKPALSPVDVTTVQERVYQSLRLALLKGEFLPGDQVSIRGLAQAFGTSAMPVRDALARLVAERAFEQPSARLMRVAPYVASEHEEYIRIRIQLEGYATERACRQGGPEIIEALKEHNARLEEALTSNNFEAALAANHAFHFALYSACGYPQLVDMISNLWLRTGPILASAQKDRDLFKRLFTIGHRIHADAISAIGRGDTKAVRRSILLDIRSTHFSIRHHFQTAGEQT
ncbi:GntR family transcriptional regulator [Roseibium marinum]|uniref:DNA-binding GntR family transcriptional regulator n=1 Tax=Roseibium marinum TaxID=281252 RepID=A0A2S3UTM8_9HYPH|nr:GntR family transcriptional regulator [Roseibium marinum]POF30920.1 DNA-binding GntR family transcriptional regulator [Roseibium marinum]